MDKQFWLERWRAGHTGFNQATPSRDLVAHGSALEIEPGSRVLVPLAGKSVDMTWLAAHGYRVLGVEIAEQAVRAFFAEQGLEPTVRPGPAGTRYEAGDIAMICGDIFDLDAAQAGDCVAVYDRAALIALPPSMRQRYAAHLTSILRRDCRMLLLTVEYDPQQMQGPPFAVTREEIMRLYGEHWQVQELERREMIDDEPRFAERGLDSMIATTCRLVRR